MRAPTDVIPHLGKGELHWREGFSAHALASTWFPGAVLPASVRAVLAGHPMFADAVLLDAFLERETDLRDGLGRHSQTDLLALLRLKGGLAVLGVEAKVEESFGGLIGDQSSLSAGQRKRLAGLAELFGVEAGGLSGLRYQLFHRAAATVFEADRYGAATAVLLVQSFSPTLTGFSDFAAFLGAAGVAEGVGPGQIVGPKRVLGLDFYAGWLADVLPQSTVR